MNEQQTTLFCVSKNRIWKFLVDFIIFILLKKTRHRKKTLKVTLHHYYYCIVSQMLMIIFLLLYRTESVFMFIFSVACILFSIRLNQYWLLVENKFVLDECTRGFKSDTSAWKFNYIYFTASNNIFVNVYFKERHVHH